MLTHTDMHTGDLNWCLSGWWPSTTFRNKLTSTNIKKCVNDRNLCSFVGGGGSHFYASQFCSSYVCKECKVQHVGLMEKLIRGQSSHPNLLTHFHPSHYAPLHLPLSASHSPTAVNELMLSHTLCLQLYLFFTPYSAVQEDRETWLFATTIREPSFPSRCFSLFAQASCASSVWEADCKLTLSM